MNDNSAARKYPELLAALKRRDVQAFYSIASELEVVELQQCVDEWALGMESMDVARYLFDRGVNVNASGRHGFTLLHDAAYANNVALIEWLVDHGANPDSRTHLERTPLVQADDGMAVDAIHALVNAGANVNAQDSSGYSALHWSATRGHIETTRALLECGANAELRTSDGETALHLVPGVWDYCRETGHEIVRLLVQYGIDVNARDQHGWDAISLAAFRGYDRVVVVLLESGANVNNAMLVARSRNTIEILENWGKRPPAR